ncbi:GNAT family N-acetyltransferase [Pseudoneobacillus rhizosphaerae]|jgi:predicted GNAT family N-acyltransferase|uniref:N-acetyltransferase YjcF n=1 Tax=Pseudoneobacillus rhizosphaerae TaxID=2880968 RepID=A0A9C7GEH3_9BACI|nr:GNAT family N-acetyltransferase [Pseudoneobacillus rhizosphaerae]CAG9610670.1 putative N-acetyltransferase YjcF [Pseudoneobacillus rhizosphaerae]
MILKVVATEEELNDAFSIRKEVFVHEQNVPEELEIDEFEDDSIHFALYQNNRPVGAGRFRELDGFGKVERICVAQNVRGTGAGKVIMHGIEEHAKGKQISTLKLNAQTSAIPFYEKLGYEIISEEFMDAGIPHKTMKKTLV